ncbi:MAG TPA: Nif3-like dinuclear metal center hexameric protein [Bacteroidota bacterium]
MTVEEIGHIIEDWAPKWTAWEKDNVGLQVGHRTRRVSRILIALDLTKEVVNEAIKKQVDLIITHHPPLFRPLSSLTDSDQTGKLILALAEHSIAVYSAHTNLDFTRNGVSFTLAQILGLQKIRFLSPLAGTLSKIVVFVPSTHVEMIAQEMSAAGAGVIGQYDACSFRIEGTGTFRGNSESKPFLGRKTEFERVREVRLEMVAPTASVDEVVEGIRKVHPYEEVAYDVYPLKTPSTNFGMGAIGVLKREVTLESFLRGCKRSLSAQSLRFTGRLREKIRTVAVCGGSGSDLLGAALSAHADVFVTADVRYHTFHSAQGRIALVDAGHWETEHSILQPLQNRLKEAVQRSTQRVSVMMTQLSTNPVRSI